LSPSVVLALLNVGVDKGIVRHILLQNYQLTMQHKSKMELYRV